MSNAAASGSVVSQKVPVGGSPPTRSPLPHLTVIRSQKARPRLLAKSFFLEYVRREQLRAIRSKSKISLVIVSMDRQGTAGPEELYDLSKVVQHLVRETDLLGWYAENAIAILLPDTDEDGAQECVQRIQAQEFPHPLSLEILAYPRLPAFLARESKRSASLSSAPIDSEPPLASRTQVALKRLQDIVGSLTGILLLSPVMLLAGIAVKATSKGPIIFKQVRLGKDGKPFVFLKFRSMYANADQNVHRDHVKTLIAGAGNEQQEAEKKAWFKMDADPRITPVGRFLRKTSIDELPQLFNVLRGDMSLVGPRPPIPYEVEAYSPWHLRRILEVKPGVTGLWQVEGRGAISFDDMVRLDLQYARHWTVLMDIEILIKTVKVVLLCRGSA